MPVQEEKEIYTSPHGFTRTVKSAYPHDSKMKQREGLLPVRVHSLAKPDLYTLRAHAEGHSSCLLLSQDQKDTRTKL